MKQLLINQTTVSLVLAFTVTGTSVRAQAVVNTTMFEEQSEFVEYPGSNAYCYQSQCY